MVKMKFWNRIFKICIFKTCLFRTKGRKRHQRRKCDRVEKETYLPQVHLQRHRLGSPLGQIDVSSVNIALTSSLDLTMHLNYSDEHYISNCLTRLQLMLQKFCFTQFCFTQICFAPNLSEFGAPNETTNISLFLLSLKLNMFYFVN